MNMNINIIFNNRYKRFSRAFFYFLSSISFSFFQSGQVCSGPSIIISEFMASNSKTLVDEDGDYSDWIELHNYGSLAESLTGCFLTDSKNNLKKWRFPDISIESGEYLVIFASSKDRRNVGNPLHTNFKLAVEGEYLGLIEPDGKTIISEFRDQYPPQFQDESYGSTQKLSSKVLISNDALAKYFVPLDGIYEQDWKALNFDDSSWPAGITGIGYDLKGFYQPFIRTDLWDILYGKATSIYLRIPFFLDNPESIYGLVLRMKIDDGYAAYLNGQMIDVFNAPTDPHWNSISLARREDKGAYLFHDVDVTSCKSILTPGTNVLSIHALNYGDSSSDLLALPNLEAILSGTGEELINGYFQNPTPGRRNSVSSSIMGPVIFDETCSKLVIYKDEPLTVQAKVYSVINPVSSVYLCYRVMFKDEVAIPMENISPLNYSKGGPNLYQGTIPPGVALTGEMLRYRIVACDLAEHVTQSPYNKDSTRAPRYHGTVIQNPALTTNVPVYHWFVEDWVSADDDTAQGTECSLFFNERFYDNILCRVRGDTIRWSHKESYKFDFNPGYPFFFQENKEPVNEINLNSTFQDKSYIRPILTLETYMHAGVPAPEAYAVRLQRNNSFMSLAIAVEQIDDQFRKKWNLDTEGALYKMFSGLNDHTYISYEKKDRLNENHEDLMQLVRGIQPDNPDHISFIFDNFDIPQLINYLAVGVICQDWDRTIKNYYFHRDNKNTGRWIILPWDKDLTFGVVGLYNDTITGWSHNYKNVCHPLYGNTIESGTYENRLFESVYSDSRLRQMFFRRLRTLMDTYLEPLETPIENRFLENRINYLQKELSDIAQLDLKKWGSGFGKYTDFPTAIDLLKKYLYERRRFLYQEHLIPEYLKVTAPGKYGNAASFTQFHLRRMEIPYIEEMESPKLTIEFWLMAAQSTKNETILSRGLAGPGAWSLYISHGRGSLNFSCPANYPVDMDTLQKINDNKWHFIKIQLSPTNIKFDIDGRRALDRYIIGTISSSKFPMIVGAKSQDGNPELDPFSFSVDDLRISKDLKVETAIPQSPMEVDQNTIGMYHFDEQIDDRFLDQSTLHNPIIIFSEKGEVPDKQDNTSYVKIDAITIHDGTETKSLDYIKIINPNLTAVDISDWKIQGLASFKFPPGSVIPSKPNENTLYIVEDLNDFMSRNDSPKPGEGLYVIGNLSDNLDSSENSLQIVDNMDFIVDRMEVINEESQLQKFLRITELMYHPGTSISDDPFEIDEYEYIEVQNIGLTELDLGGASFTDGIYFYFSKGDIQSLAPQEYAIIVRNRSAIEKRYGKGLPIAGEYSGGLNNSGEMIRLIDHKGSLIAFFEYKDYEGWPCSADGSGHSLVPLHSALKNQPEGSLMYYGNWRQSTYRGGSPGAEDPEPTNTVLINEIMINGCSREMIGENETFRTTVELFNPTSKSLDLGDYYLSDDPENPLKWLLPESTISPGSFFKFDVQPRVNIKHPTSNGCAQSEITNVLLSSKLQNNEFQVKDCKTVMSYEKNRSYGRYPDGSSYWQPQDDSLTRTNLSGNPSLVISEIMYKNSGWLGEPSIPGFIEIFNQSTESVRFDSTDTEWRINGCICFDVPKGTVIEGEGTLLLVDFDPMDLQLRSTFESIYSCSCEKVVMIGPFIGNLSDMIGKIVLEHNSPSCRTDEDQRWTTYDEVIYFFADPWPKITKKQPQSLQRRSPILSGNDPKNWFLRPPTPGFTFFEEKTSKIHIR